MFCAVDVIDWASYLRGGAIVTWAPDREPSCHSARISRPKKTKKTKEKRTIRSNVVAYVWSIGRYPGLTAKAVVDMARANGVTHEDGTELTENYVYKIWSDMRLTEKIGSPKAEFAPPLRVESREPRLTQLGGLMGGLECVGVTEVHEVTIVVRRPAPVK